MDHADIMNSCDAKCRRSGLASLTAVEKTVVLTSSVNFEVEMGGLSTFFYNSAGDHAAETVIALEGIGATYAAAALRSAIARFPGGSAPADRELRYASWQIISGSLGSLDLGFARDTPDVFSRLCSFIDAHAADLQEHGADAQAPPNCRF